ncbi:PAS domain-containing protein [Methylomonas sp. LL1]|uniref:PAS domain-containing protein n=1 Tax=Methylomonas sp. LL1 TaxID=2785785 RepID=UPI0018C3D09C|nr:PAS domain-containing protein [Methylomonas sp. LL1]QPK61540.1 PAS domain-containing protein [Methylomonas sp. LL1]
MSKKPAPPRERRLHPALIMAGLLFAAELALGVYQQISGLGHALAPSLRLVLAGLGITALAVGFKKTPNQLPKTSGISLCLDRLPQPAIILNRQGLICDINQAAADSIGQRPDKLINQPVHQLFHPAQTTPKNCLLCRHIETGQALPATDFAFPKQRWQQISLSSLAGDKVNGLLQLHFDITTHKQIEEQLALVIDGAELGFWDWDYVSGKHQVNQRWLDMLGLKAEELDHYIDDWDSRIHPEDHDRVRDLIAKHIQSGTPYVVEFRMRHKAGHWVWIQGSGSVVEHDPDSGQPTRLCGTHQNITARKQSEKNLQAAYQTISQSPSVVLKWNCAEGLPIEFATENVLPLLGYTVEQLVGGNLFYMNLIHPDDLPGFIEEIHSCRGQPECKEIAHPPYRIITRNGGIKWVQDHKLVNRNEQGQVIGYQGLVTDITRQRQQNSAIRNIISSSLEKTAASTLDNLTLLAAETLATDFTLIGELLSDGSCKTLSFCAQTRSADNLIYQMNAALCAQLAAGIICCYKQDVVGYFPDDQWLSDHDIQGFIGIPLQNDRHAISGYVVAMYRQPIPDPQFAEDILKLFAAQITSELERARAINALEIQKQRLIDAQSISHIGDWQWYWSENQFSWSDEMYRITGTNRASFIPSFASVIGQLIHPEDRNFYKTAIQNASNTDVIDFKHRIVLGDGEIRHVHQRGKVIRDDKQRAIGIQGTMQDITERLRTEQRLLEAKQEAEKATQVKSEFLANMSHEIRTPMNAIVGLVELCLNSNISSKQRDYLERVESAAHSLMTLINDILDFSKMEFGKLHLQPIPFLLEEMLDQVFSTMSELCNRKHLKLIRPDANQDYHAVVGDPHRLRQILINLIGNAIKFTEHGQIEITLKQLSRDNEKTCLQFGIADTGIGMNAEQQTRLFKAFSQGDSSVTRNYGGTGLGLVISKQLIEQMGGTISVNSQENVGTTFTFTVTLGVTDMASIHQPQTRPRKDIDTRQLQYIRDARILLVEDNEVNRIVATELLTQAQLQVDSAVNGEIALNKLKQHLYDCVLMDVQMPVMDGYQTTRHLRKLPGCVDLPVIAMTANVMSDDRNKCLQAGMNDFIGKPILPETLYSILLKWIEPRTVIHAKPDPRLASSGDIPYLYGIDNTIGLRHTAGDKTVYRKILQKFAQNHLNSFEDIQKALAAKDLATARQSVHTLKGLAGSLGAIPLQGHLIRLEELLANRNSNIQNAPSFAKLLSLSEQEMSRVISSIQSTLPTLEPTFNRKKVFSSAQTQQQLRILLDKLQAFDSDADQQLDWILSSIKDTSLITELLQIRKQIANYQFIDAAKVLNQLLDHSK